MRLPFSSAASGLVFALLASSCSDTKRSYTIEEMPLSGSFFDLTQKELSLDSLLSGRAATQGAFRENRSRMFLGASRNGSVRTPPDQPEEGFPMRCRCAVRNDTLLVSSGVGFFGGLALNFQFTQDSVTGTYFEYTDDVQPYKAHLSDTAWTGSVLVTAHVVHAILSAEPTFQSGQQLSGSVDFITAPYYERLSVGDVDTLMANGSMRFTCRTMEARQGD